MKDDRYGRSEAQRMLGRLQERISTGVLGSGGDASARWIMNEASGYYTLPELNLPRPSLPRQLVENLEQRCGREPTMRAALEYLARTETPDPAVFADSNKISEMKETLKEQNEILQRISAEALLTHKVLKISQDKKHLFVKKGDQELRVIAPKDLKLGEIVLLSPKTMQVVENLGFPPLEASPFAPATVPNVTWDDIGGLEDAKRDMIEAIELPHTQKEIFGWYGKKTVKGILLSGEPGCGKTMLGKAAANSLAKIYGGSNVRTGFMYVKGPEILNKFVGATEETIRELFIDARRHYNVHGYPAVIFIDEADAILAARGGSGFNMGNTIVPSFLTEMDGLEDSSAIVILATNRPDVLDPAIVREGRIDRKIHVQRPNAENAAIIVKMNLQKYPVNKNETLDSLCGLLVDTLYHENLELSNGQQFSSVINGAMLATCVELAVAEAIHRDMASGEKLKKGTGVSAEDIMRAAQRIFEQNQLVKHDF